MSRNISKRIELNDLEAKTLKMKADQCHLSESDYLRELIMNSQPVEAPPRQFYVQMEKVNRIAATIQRICASAQDQNGIAELKSLYVQLIGHIVEIKECVSKARFFALTAYQDWEHQVELANWQRERGEYRLHLKALRLGIKARISRILPRIRSSDGTLLGFALRSLAVEMRWTLRKPISQMTAGSQRMSLLSLDLRKIHWERLIILRPPRVLIPMSHHASLNRRGRR